MTHTFPLLVSPSFQPICCAFLDSIYYTHVSPRIPRPRLVALPALPLSSSSIFLATTAAIRSTFPSLSPSPLPLISFPVVPREREQLAASCGIYRFNLLPHRARTPPNCDNGLRVLRALFWHLGKDMTVGVDFTLLDFWQSIQLRSVHV